MLKNPKLLDIFLDIHKNRHSGILRFEKRQEKRQIVLDKGLLVFAESNLPEEHLVRILVRLELLPRAKVNEIAALMKAGKTSEEAILAFSDSGKQDLEKGRREQAAYILASLWAWDTCDMRFFPGEALVRCGLNLRQPLPEALVLAARRAVASRLVQIPPNFIQSIFRVSEDPTAKAMDYPLNNSESYVYSLLSAPAHGSEVLALLPAMEAKPEGILAQLVLLGMVDAEQVPHQTGETDPASEPNSLILQLDSMLSKFESASLYEILSVPPEANQQEIQAAYHQLARQYHPDRFQSQEYSSVSRGKAEQAFAHINKAYTTLKDPVFRADYDEKRLINESKVEVELKARAAKRSEDEKTAEALFQDGRALMAKGDYEKAVERLKGSVWLDPEKAAYHHFLGVAESEMPKLRKSAEQHFLKAIELNKSATASRLELAKLYIKVELRRKAEIQLQELMRWDPDNHEVKKLFVELNMQ
ncbi:MAG TPA: DnaJ domain-containing protein [Acidobacteriota bacterium]|nr:DnaJ domain-containing protein [Acidobacteriota bacterium]